MEPTSDVHEAVCVKQYISIWQVCCRKLYILPQPTTVYTSSHFQTHNLMQHLKTKECLFIFIESQHIFML